MTDVHVRTTGANGSRATAALIAGEDTREAIAAVLGARGLSTTTFERVDDIEDGAAPDAPAVVVLWAEDTSPSSLAASLRPLVQLFEETPIVVVCRNIQRWGIRTALTIGAAGVVLYEELESALDPCLNAVLAGQTCLPRSHQQQIEPLALSAREKQILGLVVMGFMNSQIAERLFLAESTVKSHLSSAFRKLGVRSRNEAVNLIVNPDSGLGLGILGLGGEPIGAVTAGR